MKPKAGRVYWVTGLSGAGKTTLATRLVAGLSALEIPSVLLDGDDLRTVLVGQDAEGFGRQDRLALGLRYAKLAQILSIQGIDVVVATISMFDDVYNWNRENIELYTEVFLDVPMAELRRRDSKGLYRRSGEETDMEVAGVQVPVDLPQDPTIHLIWRPEESRESVFARLCEELDHLGVTEIGVER